MQTRRLLSTYPSSQSAVRYPYDRYGARLLLESVQKGVQGPLLELGAGDGVIGVTLARRFGLPAVLVEIDAAKCQRAQHRPQPKDANVHVLCGNYFDAIQLPTKPFRCIISNPPQLPTGGGAWSVPDCGGRDGLKHIRRIIELSGRLSGPGAHLYLHLLGFLPLVQHEGRLGIKDFLLAAGYSGVHTVTERWLPFRSQGATFRELEHIGSLYGLRAFRLRDRQPESVSSLRMGILSGVRAQVLRRVVMATWHSREESTCRNG